MALAREEILLLWKSDITQVEKTMAALRAKFGALAEIMPEGGEAHVFGDISRDLANVQRIQAEVKRLEGDLARVQAARRKALTGGPAAFELPIRPGGPRPEEAAAMEAEQLALLRETQRIAGQLTQARKAGAEAQLRVEQQIAAATERQRQLALQAAAARARGAAAAEGLAAGRKEVADATDALVLNAIEERRSAVLNRQNQQLADQEALYNRLLANLPERERSRAQGQLLSGANRLNQLERQRNQILAAQQAILEKQNEPQRAAIARALATGTAPEVDVDAGQFQRLVQLQKELEQNTRATHATTEDLNREINRRGRLASAAGAVDALKQLDSAIEQTRLELQAMTGRGQLARLEQLSPGFTELANKAAQAAVATSKATAGSTAHSAALAREAELLQQVAIRMQAIRTQGIPELIPGIEQIGELPQLEQMLIGAFTGFKGRFVSTVQHILSAVAVFGAQAMVREFVQAASEVQRTFEDISTAIEFDFPDLARGTAAFDRVVEGVRRNVLEIASDLNVLPATANEAAYVMIARFTDTNLALEATRLQLLATKVATIDQSEALRALTAVGEAFGQATTANISGLDAEEQQLVRDTNAVKTYAAALDFAVFMQQKFGVTTEDVLEGTAGLAQIFEQLGFELQQTEALVGLVSQRMGTTGVVASDRLGRSIGQITTAQIRDDLLALAASSQAFDLDIADFESGADAFSNIADQFANIQRLEPETAAAITQIIGQRREAPTVAAALATWTQVQEAVLGSGDAAGQAEKRFGFLSRTLEETFNSILSQLQALAQNLAELGITAPLSLLLEAFNTLLGLINGVLNAVGNLVSSLGAIRIGDVGMDELLFNALAVMAAFRGIIRLGKAATVAQGVITGTRGGQVAAEVAGTLAPGTTKLLTKGLTALSAASVAARADLALVAVKLRDFTVVLNKIPAAIGLMNLSFLQMAGIIAAMVAVTLLVVAAIKNQNEAEEERLRVARETTANADAARAAAEAEAKAAGATPRQQTIAGLRAAAAVQEARAAAGDATAYWEIAGAAFDEEAEKAGLKAREGIKEHWWENLPSMAELVTGERQVEGVEEREARIAAVPGTIEFAARTQADLLREAVQLEIDEAQQLLGGAFTELNMSGFTEVTDQFFRKMMTDLAAADTPGEVEAIEAQVTAFVASFNDKLEATGRLASAIEGSIETFEQQIAQVKLDFQLGRITSTQLTKKLQQHADNLRQLYNDAKDIPAMRQDLAKLRERADQAQIEADQQMIAQVNQQISMLQGMPEPQRLAQEADLLEALLEDMAARGLENTDEYMNLTLRRQAALDRLRQIELERAEEEARRAVELARTEEERIAAMRVLNRVLRENADIQEREFKDYKKAADQRHQAAVGDKEAAEATLQLAQREASAKVRLSGPILSRLVAIQAEIASIDLELARGSLDYAEQLELNIRLKELLAEQSRIEVETARAYVRATVSGRDELERLRHELAVLTKEQGAVAQAYGVNSAEWYDVIGRMKETEDAIEDQVVAIRDVRRRLKGDITNQFIQAQNDILLIMDQLRLPDLGKLEKAQLQLDLAQAQAAGQRAFIDQKLFELEYLFSRGQLTTTGYIQALKSLRDNVDTTSQQGKELWLQINGLIEGMVSDVGDLAYNIPTEIRLPTLYEVRRAVQARQMRVNYQDQRRQNIVVYVSNRVDLDDVVAAFGAQGIYVEAGRYANANSALSFGGT